jgi:hypothetical protein
MDIIMKKYKIEEGLIKQVLGMVGSADVDPSQKSAIVNKAISIKTADQRSLKQLQDNMKKSQNTVNQVIGLAKDKNVRNSLKASAAGINQTFKDKINKVSNDIDTIKAEAKMALQTLSDQKATDNQDLKNSKQGTFKNSLSFLEESDQLLNDTQLSNLEDFLKKSPYLMLQILVSALVQKGGYKTWTLEQLAKNPEELKSPEMKAKLSALFNQNLPEFFNKVFSKVFPASESNPVSYAKTYPNEIADLNNPRIEELLNRVITAFSD